MTDPQTISLSPAIVHLDHLVQNNTLSFVVSLTDADGDPIDISGDDFEMEIRKADDTLVMADTEALDPDCTYLYEVVWIFSGYRRSVAFGSIDVQKPSSWHDDEKNQAFARSSRRRIHIRRWRNRRRSR